MGQRSENKLANLIKVEELNLMQDARCRLFQKNAKSADAFGSELTKFSTKL